MEDEERTCFYSMSNEGFESGYYDMITISHIVGGDVLVEVIHEVLERYCPCPVCKSGKRLKRAGH